MSARMEEDGPQAGLGLGEEEEDDLGEGGEGLGVGVGGVESGKTKNRSGAKGKEGARDRKGKWGKKREKERRKGGEEVVDSLIGGSVFCIV